MKKERILLVFPGHIGHFVPNSRPPLGVAYIAAVLRNQGHEVRALDLSLYRDYAPVLKAEIADYQPTMVGFSVLTTMHSTLRECVEICQNSVKHIIIGGPHPTVTPDRVLQDFPQAILVRGEGELTISQLVDALSQGESIEKVKGISFVKDGKVVHNPPQPLITDLDALPFPALDLMELNRYSETFQGEPIFSILTSRGCPFHCVYCCKSTHGRRWVGRSPESIVAEIEYYISHWGKRAFFLVDDLFTCDPKRVKEFCRLVKSKHLDITWRCLSRVDTVSKELMKEMFEAGCRLITFGIESCDDAVLEKIHKGATQEQTVKTLAWARAVGMPAKASMMLALPGDTPESLFRTIDGIIDLAPEYIQFNMTIPFPYTELWDTAEKEGVLPANFEWDYFMLSDFYKISLSDEEKDKFPFFVPPSFTKKELFELYSLAVELPKWSAYKRGFRSNPIRTALGAARHLIRFASAVRAHTKYQALKRRKLQKGAVA